MLVVLSEILSSRGGSSFSTHTCVMVVDEGLGDGVVKLVSESERCRTMKMHIRSVWEGSCCLFNQSTRADIMMQVYASKGLYDMVVLITHWSMCGGHTSVVG